MDNTIGLRLVLEGKKTLTIGEKNLELNGTYGSLGGNSPADV